MRGFMLRQVRVCHGLWFMMYLGLRFMERSAAAGLYGFMVYHVVLLWFMMQVKVYGLWFTMLFKGLCVNVGFMVYDASCSKVYMFAVLGLVG